MKRSLFSLVAGCLTALVMSGFTARPLWGGLSLRGVEQGASRMLPGAGSRASVGGREASLGASAWDAAVTPGPATKVAGT